jgi:hypothetical protein
MRLRALLLLVLAAAVLTSTASAALPWRAKLTATTHTPKTGAPWRYELQVVKRNGDPVSGIAKVYVYEGGKKINTIGFFRFFDGTLEKTFRWQRFLRGHRLMLVVDVYNAKGHTRVAYAVTPQ